MQQVAKWLGHADPSFTLRTYVHLLDDGVGDADFFDQAVAVSSGNGDRATPIPLDPSDRATSFVAGLVPLLGRG